MRPWLPLPPDPSERNGRLTLTCVCHAQDGYGTARAFRALEQRQGRAARVPIVACSAEVDAGDSCDGAVAAQCRIAGMDDCVVRPMLCMTVSAVHLQATTARFMYCAYQCTCTHESPGALAAATHKRFLARRPHLHSTLSAYLRAAATRSVCCRYTDACVPTQGKPLSLQALAALLLKHTGDCGSLRGLPQRLQVSSVTAIAVQVIARGLPACPIVVHLRTHPLVAGTQQVHECRPAFPARVSTSWPCVHVNACKMQYFVGHTPAVNLEKPLQALAAF